ncbi:MAG: lytic murein transglycosylase [Planktomarina sp.]
MDRRQFIIGATCASFPTYGAAADLVCPVVPLKYTPAPNPAFDQWIAAFTPRAARKGVTAKTIHAGLRGGGFLPEVVNRDRNQFQARRTLEDYLALATSDARLNLGHKMLRRHGRLLNDLSSRYGVDPYIIAAIWGIESKFGTRRGDVPTVSATATLAFDGRRASLFEKQLIAALQILQNGDVSARNMRGSWAGAMGHTQFMPTSYLSFAVDHGGDGKRDIWSDDPTDALASTAAYLVRNGWAAGVPWGREGRGNGRQITPQEGGPTFTVTRNFKALLSYNNSNKYALAVGHLSDRLRGDGPLKGPFPKDDYGLTLQDRKTLQTRLVQKGHDLGDVDGVIGRKTQCAIAAVQKRSGMAVTGQPSIEFLRALR